MSIVFGGADKLSIRLLRSWPGGLLYAPGFPNLTEQKIQEHFVDGSSVFHDGDETEIYYFLRVRNYVHIQTMKDAAIWHASVDGECHAGHFVSVADASSWIAHFRTLTPEQYAEQVYGRNFGFPPYALGCRCYMSGMIEGAEGFHSLNYQRKLWNWMRRTGGK